MTSDFKLKRVLILHNEATFYRLPLFEELNKYHQITLFFCTKQAADRYWDNSLAGYTFNYLLLRAYKFIGFIINPTLIMQLIKNPVDIYIIADNEENLITILTCAFFARLRRKPIIVWEEHVPIDELAAKYILGKHSNVSRILRDYIKKSYANWLYRRTVAFVSLSGTFSDDYLLSHGVPRSKIYSGLQVMPDQFLAKPRKLPGKLPKYYLLYLGYFRQQKGIPDLIDAFSSVRQNSVKLIIAGAGPEENKLRIATKNNKNILFPGYISGQEKAYLIESALAMVVPSYYEPWGLVVNESLYYGTPVICSSAVGGSQLIVNGENGYIFPAGQTGELKKIINNIVNNKSTWKQSFNCRDNDEQSCWRVDENSVSNFLDAIESATKTVVKYRV